MADETLRVLIVEDNDADANALQRMIDAESDMDVVAVASTGQEGVRRAAELRPDVVLMKVYLADIDGFEATSRILSQDPTCAVIMVTPETRTDFLQRAMVAGAQGYVLKPVQSAQQLTETIRTAHKRLAARQPGTGEAAAAGSALAGVRPRLAHRIAFFSPKGGQGATTAAVNVAVALRQAVQQEVVIFDADLPFGNAHMLLDLVCDHSIVDLLPGIDRLDSSLIDGVLGVHASGVKLLMRPIRPEDADRITPEHVERILTALSLLYDYVVVDCQGNYDDRLFAVLDRADQIVLVLQPDLGAVTNVERFLELADKLGYPRQKLLVVLNRADTRVGIEIKAIEERLAAPALFRLDSVGAALTTSINLGQPLVLSQPRSRYAQVIRDVAAHLHGGAEPSA